MSAQPDNTVSLKVGGLIYSGWMGVSIDRALGEPCGSFSLTASEKWPGSKATQRIAPGQSCQVLIGDTPLITGWIDDVAPAYDAGSHGIQIRGRDRTCDIVDSSAIVDGPGAWNGVSVMAIARQLLAPFGISIRSAVSNTDKVLAGHAIQMGETVWECLERALRLYGVTAMPDGLGNLLLTIPGGGPALVEMKLGGAILAGSGLFSQKDVFSDYWILGQFQGTEDTYSDPRISNGATGHASDPTIGRYRPLIVNVECMTADLDFLPKRALWEAAHRSGKGRSATIRTQGWRDAAGTIYQPNAMVRIEDGFLGIHESLLVSGVQLGIDGDGEIANLKVTRLSAFTPEPLSDLGPYENSGAAK